MTGKLLSLGVLIALSIGLSTSTAGAATAIFDVGTLQPTTGATATCSTGVCNFGSGAVTFTSGVAQLGATAFIGGSPTVSGFVTQKFGTFNGGSTETGIGQSSNSGLSVADGEIVTNSYVALKSITAGWSIAGLAIESMQDFEGAKIYGYTGALSAFSVGSATLLTTMVGCDTCGTAAGAARTNAGSANSGTQALIASGSGLYSTFAAQSIANMASFTYLVVTAQLAAGGTTAADIAISSVTLSGPVPAPEPASMALLGIGLLGLAALRRRATR